MQIPYFFRHPKVDKDTKRRSKIWAHDEYQKCEVGDRVRLEPCRALSKRKAHVVVEILRRENGEEGIPAKDFPKW